MAKYLVLAALLGMVGELLAVSDKPAVPKPDERYEEESKYPMQVRDGQLQVLCYAKGRQLPREKWFRSRGRQVTAEIETCVKTAFWELQDGKYHFYDYETGKHLAISKGRKFRLGKDFPWQPLAHVREFGSVLGRADLMTASLAPDSFICLRFIQERQVDGKVGHFRQGDLAIRRYKVRRVGYEGRVVDDFGKVLQTGKAILIDETTRVFASPDTIDCYPGKLADGLPGIRFRFYPGKAQELQIEVELFSGDKFECTLRM